MDTSTFLVKREEIQLRMEDRRRQALVTAHSNRMLSWALKGASWFAGVGTNGSGRLFRSLLWAMATPALVGMMRRGGDSLVHRVLSGVLPSKKK